MNRHERRKAAAKCKQHRNAQRPLQNKSVVIPADLRPTSPRAYAVSSSPLLATTHPWVAYVCTGR
jgi:hypothetical protein